MSSITATGNLTANPELRHTQNGRPVVRFTIIENRRRRTADGQGWEDDEPNRFRVKAWAQLAENIAASITKGARVVVHGRMVTDRWTDRESRESRTAQCIEAAEDGVAVSLRWHTVTATKNSAQADAPAATADGSITEWEVAEIPVGGDEF